MNLSANGRVRMDAEAPGRAGDAGGSKAGAAEHEATSTRRAERQPPGPATARAPPGVARLEPGNPFLLLWLTFANERC